MSQRQILSVIVAGVCVLGLAFVFSPGCARKGGAVGDEENRVEARLEGGTWKIRLLSKDGEALDDLSFPGADDEIALNPGSIAVSPGGKRFAVRRVKRTEPAHAQVEVHTNRGGQAAPFTVPNLGFIAVHDLGLVAVYGMTTEANSPEGRVLFYDAAGRKIASPDLVLGMQHAGAWTADRFLLLYSEPGSLAGAYLAAFDLPGTLVSKSERIPMKGNAPFDGAMQVTGNEVRVKGYAADDSGAHAWIFDPSCRLLREEY